jgi:hypothetical protein
MRVLPAIGVTVALGAAVLGGCSRDEVRTGEARLVPHGVVQVAEGGKAYRTVSQAKTIHNGDRVLVRSGSADVRLPKGSLALRDGSEIRVGGTTELLAGDLLALPSRSMTVKSDGSYALLRGPGRLDRDSGVTVASYEGGAEVTSAGSSLTVPALREAAIPTIGQVPRTPSPLSYRDEDPWDRRFLADAIDLGAELQARSVGASIQFRGQGRTAGFYRTLLPGLEGEPRFDESLLDSARPPGEHIVGAAIALVSRGGDFADRWRQVFDFRSQGAAWGLVAMDQSVQRVPGLLKSIDEALGRAQLPGQSTLVAAPVAVRPGPSPTTTSTTAATAPPTTPTTGKPEPPTTTPGLIPEPPPTGLPIDPIGDATVDTINGLLPGL